jgi:hypothetical protein
MNNQKNCAEESPTVFQYFFYFFWRHFSASGRSDFWRGRHFSASGLSNFWQFFGGFVFGTFYSFWS